MVTFFWIKCERSCFHNVVYCAHTQQKCLHYPGLDFKRSLGKEDYSQRVRGQEMSAANQQL